MAVSQTNSSINHKNRPILIKSVGFLIFFSQIL
jgi:hypothetical protein